MHASRSAKLKERKTGTVIGIDLGYTEMMATSEQELPGTDLGQ
ncbi:MAG: hypothetical protein ACLSE8_04340 [Parasutterella sp.]